MAYSEEWSDGPWYAALPQHPIFEVLRDELADDRGGEGKLLLCESRGDLFMWCPPLGCLLTTNLKRLHCHREEAGVYQRLYPSVLPVTQPVSLSPSPSGQYLLVVGEQYVSVLELRRVRGEGGEFSGGAGDCECSTTLIASTMLRAHCLTVQSARWYNMDTLLLLTSDGGLRLFSMAYPEIPQLSLSTLSSMQVPRTLRLEEEGPIVVSVVHEDTVLMLLERVDVLTIDLHVGAQPSAPLPMHPVTEESYTAGGCDMLALPTTPPVLIIATDSGRLLHCVYISEDESANEGMLFILETIRLPSNDDASTENLRLFHNTHDENCYCVVNAVGVFQIALAWVSHIDEYISDVSRLASVPPAHVTQIMSCPQESVADVVVVSDPMLGSAVVILSTDGSCVTEQLNRPTVYRGVSCEYPSADVAAVATRDLYYQHIRAVLQPTTAHSSPVNKKVLDTTVRQQHCYEFLQQSALALRTRYLTPQVQAKTDLIGRINLLTRRKERQHADLMLLEAQLQEQEETLHSLTNRLEHAVNIFAGLTERVEKILCRVSSCSPVLSEAELSMASELRTKEQEMHALSHLVQKAQAKIDVGLASNQESQPTPLNSTTLSTVLSSLEEDGHSIKHMMSAVQQMNAVMQTATN